MHSIDLIFFILFLAYAWFDHRSGLWILLGRLAGFCLGIITAFVFFQRMGDKITQLIKLPPIAPYIITFLVLFFVVEIIVQYIVRKIVGAIKKEQATSLTENILAYIPAVIDSFIFIALLVITITLVPQGQGIKESVKNSYTGTIVNGTLGVGDQFLKKYTGIDLQQSLSKLALHPSEDEIVSIPYHPKTLSVDTLAEQEMLARINEARVQAGAQPLVLDDALTNVARAHSRDMWERNYFSHITPDKVDPFDRLLKAKIEYFVAGENIAFSANVDVAETGLMNSEGHRKNILNPEFHKVGLGIISGGIYGEMFTQEFTN